MMKPDEIAKLWITSWGDNPINLGEKSWCYLAETEPELCFEAVLSVLEMISADPNDKVFLTLSAGPLEEILAIHGKEFISRVEKLASNNPKFKLLLGNVWENTIPEDVWSRLCECRK